MIRAHLATFPSREAILAQAINSILPQVDRLYVCLNEYSAIPGYLSDNDKIEAMIPADDLKDAGKFAFTPAPDDIVFTIDDDIIYPADYVEKTIGYFDIVDPAQNVLGYFGNAWVMKPQSGGYGWRNFMFQKSARHLTKVDIIGTGTACELGRIFPTLDEVRSAMGFVDMRHALLHNTANRRQWILPREDNYLRYNLPEDLMEGSLFVTVNRQRPAAMMSEQHELMRRFLPYSGMKFEKIQRLDKA